MHPTFAAELCSRINGVLNRSTSPTRADVSISPEVLNDFFQNIAVGSSHQPATSFILPDDDTDSGFSFNEISVDTVFKHLSSLDVHKSTGPDGLSARYLKEIAVEMLYLLLICIISHYNKELCHKHGSSPI